MKKVVVLLFLFIIIRFVSSGSVGLSPMHYKEFFEPNLERTFTFNTFNSNVGGDLKIYIEGDLAEYAYVEKEIIKGGENFQVMLKLPKNIEKPGDHAIYVGVIELRNISFGIGGVTAIEGRINIFVPFPGIYLEPVFNIENINKGESVPYEITLNNLGTKNIKVKPEIKISNQSQAVSSLELEEINISTKKSKILNGQIDTKTLSPGNYKAVLSLSYEDKKDKIEKEFKIGKFFVEILDYSYLFEKGKINPFRIEVESKWNTKINRVYADIVITDNGNIVGQFKTPFVELEPWERKNLTGYFDAASLETKRHLANIRIFFDDGTDTRLIAIYVQNPPSKETMFYIIIGISFLISLVAIISLILKNRNLRR
ncbi:MAG: hypothetical protein Q8N88_00985 [Nanoarchaeota archaeon]|nr:hypothetical protein [Nanoarchaeota archaeon]